MAATTSFSKAQFSLLLALVVFISAVQGNPNDVTCEKLGRDTCAFAVSSSGQRCVLEKHLKRKNQEVYSCRSSGVSAPSFSSHIESDKCVKACGLNRDTLGISSDYLLEKNIMSRICSPECEHSCPNINELYFNLAAGEGVSLQNACQTIRNSSRGEMAELKSSGEVKVGIAPEVAVARVNLIAPPPK